MQASSLQDKDLLLFLGRGIPLVENFQEFELVIRLLHQVYRQSLGCLPRTSQVCDQYTQQMFCPMLSSPFEQVGE
jgi:hypothetical protein